MGPPPFGGGNLVQRFPRFRHQSPLQWGHRLSAVETRNISCQLLQGRTASMGPPPFGGGNLPRPMAGLGCLGRFNGATAFRRWKR